MFVYFCHHSKEDIMDVIVNSKHNCFREYIKKLLLDAPNESINVVEPESDNCINAVAKNKNAVVILDAHSEKPFSAYSALNGLDKLWVQGLNNPVLILGWQTKDTLKESLRADISCYFGAFYSASYQYLQLPITKASFLSCLQNLKPLNRKQYE